VPRSQLPELVLSLAAAVLPTATPAFCVLPTLYSQVFVLLTYLLLPQLKAVRCLRVGLLLFVGIDQRCAFNATDFSLIEIASQQLLFKAL